jgi:hypothetical protein
MKSTIGEEVNMVMGNNTELSIYPNPVKSEATISYSKDVDRISILNIVGREIISYEVNAENGYLKINLSDLQPGVYFITAQSQGKNLVTRRFMKEI